MSKRGARSVTPVPNNGEAPHAHRQNTPPRTPNTAPPSSVFGESKILNLDGGSKRRLSCTLTRDEPPETTSSKSQLRGCEIDAHSPGAAPEGPMTFPCPGLCNAALSLSHAGRQEDLAAHGRVPRGKTGDGPNLRGAPATQNHRNTHPPNLSAATNRLESLSLSLSHAAPACTYRRESGNGPGRSVAQYYIVLPRGGGREGKAQRVPSGRGCGSTVPRSDPLHLD